MTHSILLAWSLSPNGSGPMGIGAQTALALGRALLIALPAVLGSGPMSRWVASRRGRSRVLAWMLLVAPFFTPSLLVSYGMVRFAIALIVSTWGHEALYVGVLALKLFPVAVVLRVLLPPPLSAESRHAYRLVAAASRWSRAGFHLRAAGHGPWVAGGLVFLVAFADFELASLWSVKTWTMAVFDAQIGGLALGETLRLAAWPFGVQLAVLAAVVFGSRRGRDPAPPASWAASEGRDDRPQSSSRAPRGKIGPPLPARWGRYALPRTVIRIVPWLYLGASAMLVTVAPLAIVAGQAAAGVPRLLENFVLGHELGASVLFALTAAAAASALAVIGRKFHGLALLLSAPGLFGALTVALIVLALFQTPVLRGAYDTPIPLALALTILLLPLALLLGALWLRPTPALHIARQIPSPRLIWELETEPRAIACGILFCWAYFDFTASSILAPTGFTPVFVRLHNLAHYGQTAVLSAMMIAAIATPVVVLLLTGTALRLYARGHGR